MRDFKLRCNCDWQ